MQMRYARRPCTFVQVIDILRYHFHPEITFQPGNGPVSRVRLLFEHLLPPLVVKPDHGRTVARQRLGRANILDTVSGPQTVGIAKCSQPTVGTYACPCKNYDFFHLFHKLSVPKPTKISILRTALPGLSNRAEGPAARETHRKYTPANPEFQMPERMFPG